MDVSETIRIEALVLRADGFEEAAAEEWEALRVEAGADKVWLSPFLRLSRKRFIRAVNRKEAGRADEALWQFSSFGEDTVFDLADLALAPYHPAEILDETGGRAGGRRDDRDSIKPWREADPAFGPLISRARERLRVRSGATD